MTISEGLRAVHARIAEACARVGRDPAEVELLAVSKTQPADTVRIARDAGQRAFGENRVQELAAKAGELADTDVEWHMIGSVQTNKVGLLLDVPNLVLLHSLDRSKLADRLQAALEERDRLLEVLLQVNAAGEAQKHGVAPAQAGELVSHVAAACPRLRLRGLMAMGPLHGDAAAVFARVAELRRALRERYGVPLPILSLGMTADLEAAIAAGSTMVRVGTGLFGARS